MALPTTQNVTQPRARGYGALLTYGPGAGDNLYLRLAAVGGDFTVETAPTAPASVNTAEIPEEMRSNEMGQSFGRSDFSGGEGLDRAHRRDGTDRDFRRYWDSQGIDVQPARGGNPATLRLLHDITLNDTDASTNLTTARIGSTLFRADGSNVRVSTNGGSSWANSAAGGTIEGAMAVLGDALYACIGSSVRKRDSGGSWSEASATSADGCWSAKGRILFSDATALYELVEGGADVLLSTLPSGQVWNDIVDGGNAILAAASDGNIYAFHEIEGVLELGGQTLIEEEEPISIETVQGVVFIGTRQPTSAGGYIGRLWRSTLVGLRLRESEVVRSWGGNGATLDHGPRALLGTRSSMFFAVYESSTATHVWRYDLDTGGLSRNLVVADANADIAQGMETLDDRLFVAIRGDGMWKESDDYVASGWLIGPLADHYTAAPKHWVGARITSDTVTGTEQIDLEYSTDPEAIQDNGAGSWANAVSVTSTEGQVTTEAPVSDTRSRFLATQVVITRGSTATVTPVVYAYSFRSLPTTDEVLFEIPVNLSDQLEAPRRRRYRVKGRGDTVYQTLKSYEGQPVRVELLYPADTIRGQLESVVRPILQGSRQGSPLLVGSLKVRGIRV